MNAPVYPNSSPIHPGMVGRERLIAALKSIKFILFDRNKILALKIKIVSGKLNTIKLDNLTQLNFFLRLIKNKNHFEFFGQIFTIGHAHRYLLPQEKLGKALRILISIGAVDTNLQFESGIIETILTSLSLNPKTSVSAISSSEMLKILIRTAIALDFNTLVILDVNSPKTREIILNECKNTQMKVILIQK